MSGKIVYVKDVTGSLGFMAEGREKSIRFAYRILRENCEALREALNNVEKHPISTLDPSYRARLGKDGFDMVGRFEFIYEMTSPTVKTLTNYVASISALREALYKLDSFISTPKGKSDIRAMMTKKFADSPEAAFLMDLRDNCLHGHGTQSLLMIGDNNVDGSWVPSNYFYFDKRILGKDDWSDRSKQFINSWSGMKRLIDIVNSYQKELDEFLAEALDYYNGAFKEDCEETEKLKNEYFRSHKVQ